MEKTSKSEESNSLPVSEEKSEEEEQPASGFDRGIDYKTMKGRLITEYENLLTKFNALNDKDRWFKTKRRKVCRAIIYLFIAMIQLSNGSRVTEACSAFAYFLEKGFEDKVVVKIAKSKATKYRDGKEFITKTRFRKIKFPSKWMDIDHTLTVPIDILKVYYCDMYDVEKLVLAYMLRKFQCNTHSLRYSFINYMLLDQKKEMVIVAKFVGHANINQLVRYTQLKETDKIFDMDI